MTTPHTGATNGDAAATSSVAPSYDISCDKATTPLEAIERSIYALAEQLTGSVSDAGRTWSVSVHARASDADPVALEHRLRQEINDQVLRVRIAERTDPLRNLVFALAFSRSGLAPGGGPHSPETEAP